MFEAQTLGNLHKLMLKIDKYLHILRLIKFHFKNQLKILTF